MNDVIYVFNGKDITMNVCIQIRAIIDVIKKEKKVSFVEFDTSMIYINSMCW